MQIRNTQCHKKYLRFLLVFGLFFCIQNKSFAYTNKPVLLKVNAAHQSDTMGFNITYTVLDFFYSMFQKGKIILWDSPYKQSKITFNTLTELEKSSGADFLKSQDIYLHEFWTSARRKTTFTIVGISFINQGKNGKVSYGYVDFTECWNQMANFKIVCNVNGPAELTLVNALYSRNYYFEIIQFGLANHYLKTTDADKIKKKAFYSKRVVDGKYKIPRTKDMSYIINPDINEPAEIGNVFFKNIQTYLNNNREVLFNIGADRYFDYKTFRSEIVITRIEVNETWTQLPEYVQYDIKGIRIFVNNQPLDEISLDLLLGWDMLYNLKTAEDVLKEKKYRYTISKINSIYVSEDDSPKYMKALVKYSWTQISRYVKFY